MGDNPFLLFWLAIFALGLLGMAWKWRQWRAIHAGRAFPGRHEVAWRNLICSALTAGVMGLLWQFFDYMRANAASLISIAFCAVLVALMLVIGAIVDRRNGRAAP